ncbi:MAG: polyprenyl synthetase family protein [Firmicutes bacterium]|nr:polyprenyl synthetase family protein [Bacillota bacterium]
MYIFSRISEDLQQVQLLIRKNFCFQAGHLSEFIPPSFSNLEITLRPGIVITAGNMFGPVSERLIALAAVMQLIFISSRIHASVKESAAAKERHGDNRGGFQYPILVGDYLYSKSFTMLCEYSVEAYLNELAELICHINQSNIHDLRNAGSEITDWQQYLEIVQGETARLFACAACLGADLNGADQQCKNKLYHFGLNFGMAFGLLDRGATPEQVKDYLTAAEANLYELPPQIDSQCFRNLLTSLSEDSSLRRMVG